MTILIDPPSWPAHGTVFSHLVSDSSYAELHRFARSNSISERAFDVDHYDVPAELYDRLVDAGAHAVNGRELTRRLITSGLRVPLRERPSKIRNTLLRRWKNIFPQHVTLGDLLLDQWEEQHRYYHNSVHLLEMLVALDQLYAFVFLPRAVVLAAWLHDIVYRGLPGQDERDSAEYAGDILTPLVTQGVLQQSELEDTVALIMATINHRAKAETLLTVSPSDLARFLDADMAILGASRSRYQRYAQAIRAEYSHYKEQEFVAGRSKILQDFLDRESLFLSAEATKLWESKARENLAGELAQLSEKKFSSF